MAPTLYAGLRLRTSTYVYDDPDHPDRPTSVIHSPDYTHEDQLLIAALDQYESGLCRCGEPRVVAWHSEMDGWYGREDGKADRYVCHACTAQRGEQVVYAIARDSRPAHKGPLPPFVLGVTTTSP